MRPQAAEQIASDTKDQSGGKVIAANLGKHFDGTADTKDLKVGIAEHRQVASAVSTTFPTCAPASR